MVGGGSIRWSPYIYAGANPINYLDPSGRFFWPAIVIGAVAGLVINAIEQIHALRANGTTDLGDIIKCLNVGALLQNAILGAIAGAMIGAGGGVALSAGLAGGGYFVGTQFSKAFLGTQVDTSFKGIATNVIAGGILGKINNLFAPIEYGKDLVIRGVGYAAAGGVVLLGQNILTDDDPLYPPGEGLTVFFSGLWNAMSLVGNPYLAIPITFTLNTIITAVGNVADTIR